MDLMPVHRLVAMPTDAVAQSGIHLPVAVQPMESWPNSALLTPALATPMPTMAMIAVIAAMPMVAERASVLITFIKPLLVLAGLLVVVMSRKAGHPLAPAQHQFPRFLL